MTSTTIVLIRHGETAWNAERRLQGHLDVPLNAEGERQAEALAEALAGASFDLLVTSDLQRARQTGAPLARACSLTPLRDPALRERCFGAFEGLLYAEIAQRFPQQFAAWQARAADAPMPDGVRAAETFRQFQTRAVGAVLAWAQAHPGKSLAIVTHGGVLECVYRFALGMPLETARTFPVLNASINRIVVTDGALSVRSWGEVAHLRVPALDELA